jgi:deoxyribodipyrimidine photo-lyase
LASWRRSARRSARWRSAARGASAVDSFLEELIIRRELSDNFCYFNLHYDSFEGAPDWAKQSLTLHAGDAREQLYTYEQLRDGATYDTLWNAAQRADGGARGKMSGFMRMYWAKKIGEWTASAAAGAGDCDQAERSCTRWTAATQTATWE